MVQAFRSGRMVRNTRDFGKMVKPTEKVNLFTLMGIYMKETGRMTRLVDMASIFIIMERSIREIGLMITSMAMVFNLGLMAASTKVLTNKGRKMVRGNTSGEMEAFTKEAGRRIRLLDMEYTFGQMVENIKAIG